jgi:glycosyltransferase involved in cell wall biosynthesis
MKILFVITGLGVGGAERQVLDLADRFSLQGHQVIVAYMTGEAKLKPMQAGVRIVGFNVDKSVKGLASAYSQLRQLVKSFQPDVVHSHMVHANLLSRLVRLTTRIPRLVCTAHNTNEGGALRMLAYRVTDRLADFSSNVSAEAVAAFEKKGAAPAGRMVAIANGIDTDRYQPNAAAREATRRAGGLNPEDKLILAVGRLADAKDYPNLLQAFCRLARTDSLAKLWIAGGGELLPQLQQLAADGDVADRVSFLGVRSDIPALFNAADVYVLSSAWEGLPLVVGEAMASEKVVVATDCGGVKEFLGDCGFLVPNRNAEKLADAMRDALSLSGEQAAALGARARQRIIKQYSLEKAVDTWTDIYQARGVAVNA